ncbi:terpineol synthase, chloroplastic-like isoform X2 [Lycium ferocissimum]|uniref:terpineol synthase, chloroplastic-like isoform X2 n=1 Tax=Lycium ferocissimum TaxID=112874 RepID=UPI002814FA31|nr:terpineol synthase, chloroplastic-like isoform X2 [Lycium ferocissimum]
MAMATIISASIITKPNFIWTLQVPKSGISNAQAGPSIRRSGNYQPSIWDYTHIQSLKNQYSSENFIRRRDELKMEVKIMLNDRNMKPLDQLEIIDNLQRLGLSYHFEDEIYSIMNIIYGKNSEKLSKRDHLYAKALEFRLLRQHGFNISQAGHCTEDTKGMLYLYEASFLATEGENELELARTLTEKHLRVYLENKNYMDQNLAELVHHALELPLHWRMLRLEARWFINFYKKRQDMIPFLLELASLDFNIVQAAHVEDLKYVSRWWKETCLAENLPFGRDRLVENFFWTVGVNFLPPYGYFRRIATKVNALVTTIDDVYDVFGTLDELQIFTDAIQRWNINELDKLPDIMKMCYFALDNFINEVAGDAFEEHGIFILPYLRNAWTNLCNSYLREAKWYHSQYTPTMEEYMDNAWISITAPVILVHAYFLVANPVNKEALHYLENYHDIIRCSALILRLANDLGTSSDELKRGDVPKSIQCYMNETKASEEEARQHIRVLISQTWKKMNEAHDTARHPFPKIYVKCAMSLARMAQCMYQHGDGHGGNNSTTTNRIMALLFESIPPAYKRSSAKTRLPYGQL